MNRLLLMSLVCFFCLSNLLYGEDCPPQFKDLPPHLKSSLDLPNGAYLDDEYMIQRLRYLPQYIKKTVNLDDVRENKLHIFTSCAYDARYVVSIETRDINNFLALKVGDKIYEVASRNEGSITWSLAKELCDNSQRDGKTGWQLPDRHILNAIYEELHEKGVGGFTPDYYWSSSEGIVKYAWRQSFYNGHQMSNYKGRHNYSRCVRAL